MINSEKAFKITQVNIKYYEEEALNFLPKLIENLIEYRIEDLMFELEIPETSCCIDKFTNNDIYLEWYLKLIHKSYEDILNMDEDSIEYQMKDKSHLVAFLFKSKKVTEHVLKILMENNYSIDTTEEEILESEDNYKIIHIKWNN